jgi:CRP-like cAMP-binding protein
MSVQHLEILGDCAMATQFAEQQVIFREGDLANRFYLMEKGKVALESRTADGKVVLVETIGPGDALGWSWLFPPYYWHFGARALDRTEAIFFYGTRLRASCDGDHDFGYELVRRMAEVAIRRLQSTRRSCWGVSKTGKIRGASEIKQSPPARRTIRVNVTKDVFIKHHWFFKEYRPTLRAGKILRQAELPLGGLEASRLDCLSNNGVGWILMRPVLPLKCRDDRAGLAPNPV